MENDNLINMPKPASAQDAVNQAKQDMMGQARNQLKTNPGQAPLPDNVAVQIVRDMNTVTEQDAIGHIKVKAQLNLVRDAGLGGFMLAVAAQAIAASATQNTPELEFAPLLRDLQKSFNMSLEEALQNNEVTGNGETPENDPGPEIDKPN